MVLWDIVNSNDLLRVTGAASPFLRHGLYRRSVAFIWGDGNGTRRKQSGRGGWDGLSHSAPSPDFQKIMVTDPSILLMLELPDLVKQTKLSKQILVFLKKIEVNKLRFTYPSTNWRFYSDSAE